MTHDVRAVANAILDFAAAENYPVTNLSLNKIIYFLHAGYLHEFEKPLVSAKIEAWDHGPVLREIYHQFKRFGAQPVQGRAKRLDPDRGTLVEVRETLSEEALTYIHSHLTELLRIPAGKLVDMSHVPDGAWYAARYGNGMVNPGVEITDDLIHRSGTTQAKH